MDKDKLHLEEDEDDFDGLPVVEDTVPDLENQNAPQALPDNLQDAEIIVEVEGEEQAPATPPKNEEAEPRKPKGARAEKRIRQLVSRVHDLERELENTRKETSTIAAYNTANQDAAIRSADAALTAEQEALKMQWIEAEDSGDSAKKFEVNQKLTELQVKRKMLDSYKARVATATPPKVPVQEQQRPVQRSGPLTAAEIENVIAQTEMVNPNLGTWIKKNQKWFFHDTEMREAAMKISDRMIQREGYDPDGDEYLAELDRRLGNAFPSDLGKAASARRSATPVRTPGGSLPPGTAGAKPVIRGKLTADEVRMAKEMGFTPEQWLASKLQIERESPKPTSRS